MQRINYSKEFIGIIDNYKYESEIKHRLLKQGKTFEQGLRDMLHQRNLDIKKHEMEEDEAEKLQSHLGGLTSSSNRLKIAMKSMEDDLKKEDRRNVISVLIKSKDDDLDKEKISDISDFASEDAGESALNKKIHNKTGGLQQKKYSMSKNPMLPNTLFNSTRRSSSKNLSSTDFDSKVDHEYMMFNKQKKNSSKKINIYVDGNGNKVIIGV